MKTNAFTCLYITFQIGKLPNAEFEILAQEMKQVRYKGKCVNTKQTKWWSAHKGVSLR